MRLHPGCGVWEIFVPGISRGAVYKFEIQAGNGDMLPVSALHLTSDLARIDPVAKAWGKRVEAIGELGMTELRQALATAAAAGATLGMPKVEPKKRDSGE